MTTGCCVLPRLDYTIPPPSLMVELNEVATNAGALAVELARANRLPSDFPGKQVQELLAELQTLPAGTAEGCRNPLEVARGRLPALRRKYIEPEERSRRPRTDDEEPPPLTRGMIVDVRLGVLVNSVTTALDEYRALASVEEDDAADTAPSLAIDPASPDVLDAMAASRHAQQMLGKGVEELEAVADSGSATGDNLKRQMRDAQVLLSLARVELQMPEFVPRWYRKTVDTVRDYPRILSATAKAMTKGVDVARPMLDAWHHFEHGLVKVTLDAVERAAWGLSAVAGKWEAERSQGNAEPGADAVPPPPDFDLGEVRAMVVRGEAPPPSWRPWINSLDLRGEITLVDLSPLSGLFALKHLNLEGTRVRDLTVLSNLSALQSLNLCGTQVKDLTALSGLIGLQTLSLEDTHVSDIAPLASLSALKSLSLMGSRVSDTTALSGLAALETLILSDNIRG